MEISLREFQSPDETLYHQSELVPESELQRYKKFLDILLWESKLNRNKDEFNEYKERLG